MKLKIVDLRASLRRHPTQRYRKRALSNIDKLVLHSNGLGLGPRDLNDWFIAPNPISDGGCARVPYHYYINEDGTCNYMTDRQEISWHAGNFNGTSVGICFKQEDTQTPPTKEALTTMKNLLVRLCLALKLEPQNILGHRELYGTGYFYESGERVYRRRDPWRVDMNAMRHDVAMVLQTILKRAGHYKGKIDGVFGRKSKKAMKKFSRRAKKG